MRKRAATLQRGVTFDGVAGIGEAMTSRPRSSTPFCASRPRRILGGQMPTACSHSGRLWPATLSWLSLAPG